jgi:hypothetical protein
VQRGLLESVSDVGAAFLNEVTENQNWRRWRASLAAMNWIRYSRTERGLWSEWRQFRRGWQSRDTLLFPAKTPRSPPLSWDMSASGCCGTPSIKRRQLSSCVEVGVCMKTEGESLRRIKDAETDL